MKLDFFLPQITQFYESINLFCLILLTLEFLFPVFFTPDTIVFHSFFILYIAFSEFLISSFISLYSLITLSTDKNSSFLIYESLKDTLKVFNDFKNKQKCVLSNVVWNVKEYIFRKRIQYDTHWDKTQMLKKISFGQNKRSKKSTLFSFMSSNSS